MPVLGRGITMDYEMIYGVASQSALCTFAVVLFIICCLIWMVKQIALVACAMLKHLLQEEDKSKTE